MAGVQVVVLVLLSLGVASASGEPPPSEPRWSESMQLIGEISHLKVETRAWKEAGKAMFEPSPGDEPHALLYGNLGAIRRRTGAEIVWVDGRKTYHGFKTFNVMRVRPGRHEVKVRYMWSDTRYSDAILTTTVEVEAGRAYRFWAAGKDSFVKGNKGWVAFVQSSSDVELLRLPPE